MTFSTLVRQRWVDLDAQAHVNNARILDYLQEARVAWLHAGRQQALLGRSVVVVEHQIVYLASVDVRDDGVEVDLGVGRVRASQFELGYDVRAGGSLVAQARTRMCYVDPETGRPAPAPVDARAWFQEQSSTLARVPDLGGWRVGSRAHRHPVTVRWSDIDAYRHVNNVTYFDYVAEARIALNRTVVADAITLGGPGSTEHRWLVARQDIRYLTEMVHRIEPYQVRTAVASVGRTSLRLIAEIVDADTATVFARTATVLVHADPAGRPSPVPEALRTAADRWPAVPHRRRVA
ncbi:MAG: acyl-CoA thioesterase [Propioniciclava sp.]